jgi:uncharacterized protein (DUF427 family)
MKTPGPDHPITVAPNPNRVVVTFGGRTLADSSRALTLGESTYPPVHYIPREDVDMTLLERSAHATRCPYKGKASYYSVRGNGRLAENAGLVLRRPLRGGGGNQGPSRLLPESGGCDRGEARLIFRHKDGRASVVTGP